MSVANCSDASWFLNPIKRKYLLTLDVDQVEVVLKLVLSHPGEADDQAAAAPDPGSYVIVLWRHGSVVSFVVRCKPTGVVPDRAIQHPERMGIQNPGIQGRGVPDGGLGLGFGWVGPVICTRWRAHQVEHHPAR